MSDFFSKVAGGTENLQKDFLGETYPYHKNINTPASMGMSGKGDMPTLARNIAGIVNYTKLLVEGTGRASKTGRPLGNKFFLKTGGSCEPKGYVKSNGKIVEKGGDNSTTRYLYINNQPDGSIPFISSGAGANFGSFRGLIPGIIGNIGHINPVELMGAFGQKGTPPCYKVTMPTIDAKNRRGKDSQYVAKSDLANMNGCNFPGGYNPITKKRTSGCKQGFDIMQNYLEKGKENSKILKSNKDPIVNIYNTGFGLLLIYLLMKIMKKA